jgi:hypothetical protein
MALPGSLLSACVDASGIRRECRQRLRTCSITHSYEAYRDVSLKLKFVGAENKEAGKPADYVFRAAGNRGAERDLSSCGLALRCSKQCNKPENLVP